jgi:beta-lactamase class A
MPRAFTRRTVIPILIAIALGAVAGWFGQSILSPGPASYRGSVLRQGGYDFIDPILACDTGTQEAFPEFTPIKNELTALIGKEIKAGSVKDISVYIRSLKTGRWFEINPGAEYAPASLLKVFVMMAYYKEAEDTPIVLKKQVSFEGSKNPGDDTPGEVIPHLTSGAPYTIDALIRQMIIYSDNDALKTLIDAFDPQTLGALQGVFSDLNIPSPLSQSEEKLNFMPVSSYAMVFRVLFGGTYLTRMYSEKALKLLSEAHYAGAIVAGVPVHIPIAHKFGVRTVSDLGSTHTAELHDCGIVYYPNHPYLLCVMTRGGDFPLLERAIQDISRTTYRLLDVYYTSLPLSPVPPR